MELRVDAYLYGWNRAIKGVDCNPGVGGKKIAVVSGDRSLNGFVVLSRQWGEESAPLEFGKEGNVIIVERINWKFIRMVDICLFVCQLVWLENRFGSKFEDWSSVKWDEIYLGIYVCIHTQ